MTKLIKCVFIMAFVFRMIKIEWWIRFLNKNSDNVLIVQVSSVQFF